MASGFSIFATILAGDFFSEIIFCNSFISFTDLTKDKPIHSMPVSKANSKSARSLLVKQGKDILVFGRFTPFFDFNSPP